MGQTQSSKAKVAAVIVAAGRGERAGREGGPKQYRQVGGRPVISWAVERFVAHPEIDMVVVVIHADDMDFFREAAGPFAERVRIVVGGPSRQASTRLGLESLDADDPATVLIHDGVRPFCDDALISRTLAAISAKNGAIPAMAVADTLKFTNEARQVERTVPRDRLFAAQTPQAFPFRPILAAHRKAMAQGREDFTDDSGIAEFSEVPVFVVEGSPDNVKLTWADDIAHADRKLRASMPVFPDVRTGNGYDVHAFGLGDHVTLCGVAIPHGKALSGHSDADVGLHALTDALLATCGTGDIGTHFPPSDPQWRGAASRIFVEHAAKIVREAGGRIANADITLICEGPKIAPHRDAMTAAISAALGIAPQRVSVKATTNEKLGFIGRDEGIAAIATASVVFPGELPE